jgi:very-short-patch-repair endonuclease
MKKIWSKENALKDALNYQSRSEWKKGSYGYEVASKNGWLEDACTHMTGGKGVFQKGYWTLERCIEDAKKYKSKSEWRNSEKPTGFNVAKTNGWLMLCCQHMNETKKPNGYWGLLDNCLKDASRFTFQARWEEESPSAVASARKNGWLERCIQHMKPSTSYNLKWTKEAVIEDAKSFDTLGEWREKSGGAYAAASKNGWVKEVAAHMTSVVSQGEYQINRFLLQRDIKFEMQKRFPECKDITYLPFDFYLPDFNLLVEFQGIQHITGYRRDKKDAENIARRDAIKKQFASSNNFHFLEIWKTSDIEKLLVEKLEAICRLESRELELKIRKLSSAEESTLKSAGIWTIEKCMADSSQYLTKTEWSRNSAGAYSAAHKNGWIELCSEHMTALWEGKWDLEACKADALKYQNKTDWSMNSVSAYNAAHRKGWLSECCAHMTQLRRPNGYWTLQRCQDDAKQFSMKKAWRLGSPSGYATAKAKGWVALCCEHMK